MISTRINSDIFNVAVLTQYKPRSLNDHIGNGKPWDLDRALGGVRLLQPYVSGEGESGVVVLRGGEEINHMECPTASRQTAIRVAMIRDVVPRERDDDIRGGWW